MGAKRVTPTEVEEMYKLYSKLGTYAAVAKQLGRSSTTVAKYIKAQGYKPLGLSVAAHTIKES